MSTKESLDHVRPGRRRNEHYDKPAIRKSTPNKLKIQAKSRLRHDPEAIFKPHRTAARHQNI
jgi:hypothetical protein